MARIKKQLESYTGDPLVPLLNLVCLLIPLMLYGAVFVRFVTLEVNSPSFVVNDNVPKESKLNLTVMITELGFHLKTDPRHRLPWMSSSSSIADIPKKMDSTWDFDTLNKRLRQIKEINGRETNIVLGAEDDISFDTIIKTMDFARGSNGELFPNVTLTRGLV